MTNATSTHENNHGDVDVDPSKASASASANRRFNPYDGMDPNDPNYVGIPPEEFQAMMRKKKSMGIPSLEILKAKANTNKSNAAATATTATAADSNTSSNNNNKHNHGIDLNSKLAERFARNNRKIHQNSSIDTNDEEENVPPPPVPPEWDVFLKMQKARVPNDAILQLAKAQGKTPTHSEISELRRLLGLEVDDISETESKGESSVSVPASPSPSKRGMNEAIVQLAKAQGKTLNHTEVSELRRLRGMDLNGTSGADTDSKGESSTSLSALPSISPSEDTQSQANRQYNPYDGMDPNNPNYVGIPPDQFQAMMRKKKAMGIPSLEILKAKANKNKSNAAASNTKKDTQSQESSSSKGNPSGGDGDGDGDGDATTATESSAGVDIDERDVNVKDADADADVDQSKFAKYIQMRERGIAVSFVLEVARNQLVTTVSEYAKLEAILAEVQPTKSTRAIIAGHGHNTAANANVKADSGTTNNWFTPIQRKEVNIHKSEDDEDTEKVAFHRGRTSPLASLVRKMVHTVDKTSRSSHRNKSSASSKAVDDLVVDSKILYQALGSFQGVQIACSNYNQTLIAVEKSKKEKASDTGWIRAKRQSFREIAKSIGVKLPRTNSTIAITAPTKDGAPAPAPAPAKAAIEGLDALVRYIKNRYSDEIRDSQCLLRDDKLYDFDSLSALYVPGSRVVAKSICSGGVDMICKVSWNRIKSGKTITGQTSKHFEVCFEFVVAVGTNKATIAEVVEGIDEFEGRRNIFSSVGLTFVPWMAYGEEEQASLLERYRYRGRVYNEVALNHHPSSGREGKQNQQPNQRPMYSYKAYRKGCFFVKRGGFGGAINATSASRGMANGGKIIVDAQGAYEYGNSLGVGYDPMIDGIRYKLKEYRIHQSRVSSNSEPQGSASASGSGDQSKTRSNHIVDAAGNLYDASSGSNIGSANQGDDDDESGGMVLFDVIPEDYLELVWPCVIGFSLTAKAWGDCLVDGLEDIRFSEDVFDRLVLPDDRKRLIKALVKHSSPSSSPSPKSKASSGGGGHNFQDLIQGKGEGTVFLLYGPPGVGKTLTAEAVAEVLHRPLYSLSMGTLGTTADDLERRLAEILRLSSKWNAIILLDEADSFLERRSSTSSLERNAMVSVMLQLVEYFSGILFLTSNRMDSLDPAFQTRITLSLPYHDLTQGGRQKIWDNLLHTSGVLSPIDIDTSELAKHPLNGREIKNALRLALALAAEEDRPLNHKLLMETSSMVKPISAFGKSSDLDNETADGHDHNRKLSLDVPSREYLFWHVFVPALPILFLLIQNGRRK